MEAHCRAIDLPENIDRGELLRIAIVDSVLEPHPSFLEHFNIGVQENYVASNEGDTTGHGSAVLAILSYICPDATFDLYRVIAEDKKVNKSNFTKALKDIQSSGASLVNVSCGRPSEECRGQCRYCTALRETTVETETPMVVAAGNSKESGTLPLHCPGRVKPAITVGSLELECNTDESRQEIIDSDNGQQSSYGPYYALPAPDDDEVERRGKGVYCGMNTCLSGDSCILNNSTEPWDYNPRFREDKPDVLAPHHWPQKLDGNESIVLTLGTSWATPLVGGALARMVGELHYQDIYPTPGDLREGVLAGAKPFEGSTVGSFNASSTWRHINNKLNQSTLERFEGSE